MSGQRLLNINNENESEESHYKRLEDTIWFYKNLALFTWGGVTLILIKNKVIPGLFLTCSCLIIKVNGKEQARLHYP